MGKNGFNPATIVSRALKALMVFILIPVIIGMLWGILEHLNGISLRGTPASQWIKWGFFSYIGLHLLLYRPAGLFRASHRMFSVLAVWLFGGHVATVDQAGAGAAKGKGTGGNGIADGSPLVAFSPYVVPLLTVIICLVTMLLSRWLDRQVMAAPAAFIVGVSMAFHWFMTADELQQQRERWYIETYLLAIGLVFFLTLLVAAACLPWAIPEFSLVRALGDGMTNTQAIYSALIKQLFF